MTRASRGFTLIEILIVVGILGILTAVILVAIAPRKSMRSVRDAERKQNSREVTNAMFQYLIDNGSYPNNSTIPTSEAQAKPVCKQGVTSNANCVQLDLLVSTYLVAIPQDDTEPCTDYSGYQVYNNVGRATVFATHEGKLAGDDGITQLAGCSAGGGGGSSSAASSSASSAGGGTGGDGGDDGGDGGGGIPAQQSRSGNVFVNNNPIGGHVAWVSPESVEASDDVYATATTLYGDEFTHYLLVTDFNFAIPAGATITGIEVEVERSVNNMNDAFDNGVRLLKNMSSWFVGDNASDPWPHNSTDATVTYGSSSDLWGTTWTAEEINAEDFGFAISAIGEYLMFTPDVDPQIDHIGITVHYEE